MVLVRYGSLCTGIGGLDRAIEDVFGAHMAFYAEIDKDACKVLARHYPGVPNLGDISAVDWEEVEHVDLICAGPPCQPVSVAGKREGENDERWLWPDVLRAVERLRPRWLVFENPPGIAPWLPAILRRLAGVGYVGRFGRVAAGRADADTRLHVGACHTRERIFIVAHPSGEPGWLQPVGLAGSSGTAAVADAGAGALAHPDGEGRTEDLGQRQRVRGACGSGDGPAPDAEGIGRWPGGARRRRIRLADGDCPDCGYFGHDMAPCVRCGRVVCRSCRVRHKQDECFPWGRYAPAVARHERVFGRAAPWPVIEGTRSLNGDFTAWMMDVEEGMLDGISNTAKKRLCGNAVMTRQAIAALVGLVSR